MKLDRTIQKISMLLIIFLLINSSCTRWCANHSLPSYRDSIVTKEVVKMHDTTIYIPSGTITLTKYLPCPDFDSTVETKKQIIRVLIKDKQLTATGICKEDSLKAELIYKDIMIRWYKQLPAKEIKVTPIWNWLLFGAMSIAILFLIVRILLK